MNLSLWGRLRLHFSIAGQTLCNKQLLDEMVGCCNFSLYVCVCVQCCLCKQQLLRFHRSRVQCCWKHGLVERDSSSARNIWIKARAVINLLQMVTHKFAKARHADNLTPAHLLCVYVWTQILLQQATLNHHVSTHLLQ